MNLRRMKYQEEGYAYDETDRACGTFRLESPDDLLVNGLVHLSNSFPGLPSGPHDLNP